MEKGNNAHVGPLNRFKVLDLTRVRAGPVAVRQLADWGADVIKIEAPAELHISDGWGGPRNGPDFQNLHRSKRSLTLNLKDPKGLEIFEKLAQEADVIVENFRPEVKFRLGIDYDSLKKVNPRLVYASISGFGQDGPYAKRVGFDHIIQGLGGLMAINGMPGNPPMRVGIAISDVAAGLYCALGILTALLERDSSGEGQWVQVSLLQAMIALLDFQAARWLISGEIPVQAGNDHPTSIPTGVFPTSDGYITIAAGEQKMWERLCRALGAEDLIARPEYATDELRSQNRAQVNRDLSAHTSKRSSKEWLEVFAPAGVAAGSINSMDQVFADPQVQHLNMAVPVMHPQLGMISLVGQPFSLTRTAGRLPTVTPTCGEHTDEILMDLGYTADQIGDLHERLVI